MVWIPFSSQTNDVVPTGPVTPPHIELMLSPEGAIYQSSLSCPDWLYDSLAHGAQAELASLLAQLEDEGFAQNVGNHVLLPWDEVYRLMSSNPHQESFSLLGLPPVVPWRPILDSQNSLTDADFSIALSGWIDPGGKPLAGNAQLEGAVLVAKGQVALLPRETWETVKALAEFNSRVPAECGADSNRRAWAKVRRHALVAQANLSNFLAATIVLTPERLKIGLRKEDFGQSKLLEIMPGFEGEPPRWLEIFDRFGQVLDRYEIPDGEGLTHVMISPEAKTVLREIKRMPGRRIAGERAEAFIRNPFAALGPDAGEVIDPQQFEQAREEAGIFFARFSSRILRDKLGFPFEVSLLIEEALGGEIRGEVFRFENTDTLECFILKLEGRIASQAQCCAWEGFDLEILGDTPDQLALLREALRDWRRPEGFTASEIFDLSRYSDRVYGFGSEKPYYSPFIARKNEESGWFPDNVVFGLVYSAEGSEESIGLALSDETLGQFQEEVRRAKEEQRTSFSFQGCPKPIEVGQAEEMLAIFKDAAMDVSKGTFDPKRRQAERQTPERKGLVVKPNIATLDHEERRGVLALPGGAKPRLPKSLRREITLKEHQLHGVTWLQHLWSRSPTDCRGALLADDMGLGKTVQLLTFIARCLEEDPSMDPFLVIAPVSLLENWKEEIDKFFDGGAIPVLTLYGPALTAKRLSRDAIEEELSKSGVAKLLARNWLGNAKVVLTTYETLRDLEFSFALKKWSVMICDEAQKIKNPNALVTRAAKKQNARLKIACTGTPVENSLTDLWSLFDFIQPGILGALNDFGVHYRKPIEAETEEEKARIEELQALIDPQKLRRTKAEVAKDLPQRIEVEACRKLPISDRQRAYYANAISTFRRRAEGERGTGLQSHLGLLQYLRRLCSDPRPPGQLSSDREPLAEIEAHSPKMNWLLRELESIKHKGEKAIVFCEFRDLQRTLQRAIGGRFGITPDVINGDTTAASTNANNRQKRIKAFQQTQGFGTIILSPLAVGFGLNIQAANHVIHFSRTWNPAKEDQATDRAYRIGQTKDVYVYCPVVVADDFITFDAKLDKLLEWRRALSKNMLNGAGDIRLADFGDLEDIGGGRAFCSEPLRADDIPTMDPDGFEAFCALLWGKHGYAKVYRTPRSGDGGIDVVAIQGKTGVLIQCKSSSRQGQELGWEAIKDVVAGAAGYLARHPGVRFSLVATTNQCFNSIARSQANLNHVELVDRECLAKMLAANPVTRGELENLLFATWDAQSL